MTSQIIFFDTVSHTIKLLPLGCSEEFLAEDTWRIAAADKPKRLNVDLYEYQSETNVKIEPVHSILAIAGGDRIYPCTLSNYKFTTYIHNQRNILCYKLKNNSKTNTILITKGTLLQELLTHPDISNQPVYVSLKDTIDGIRYLYDTFTEDP